MSTLPTAGAQNSTPLSTDNAEFLIELAVTVHKNAIYPSQHPLLVVAVENLHRRLTTLLGVLPTLSIGVARRQLIIEGVATDENHPILRELAQRLHRHQIGAMRFTRGVTGGELADVLATLAADVGRVGAERPLGLSGPEVLARWQNVRLFALTFEQLELIEEEEAGSADEDEAGRDSRTRAAQLWIGLAHAAIAQETAGGGPASTDPDVVASAIDERVGDNAYDQVVVGYMLQIAGELKAEQGRATDALKRRISRLVRSMRPETLQRLLSMGGDGGQRKQFVIDATHGLAVNAVVDVVRAAADVSGQTISHSIVRLLSKLAANAEGGAKVVRPVAESELRDQVRRLIASWDLADPNPEDYSDALRRMSQASPDALSAGDREPCEPRALVELSLEVSVVGPVTRRALDTMRERGELGMLLDLLDTAREGETKDAMVGYVVTPAILTELLERDPPPVKLIERLVARLQDAAVPPLIDLLERADERVSTWACDTLVHIGAVAGPPIVARLDTLQPAVLRQMLGVLDRIGEWPEGFSPITYASHDEYAIRREAIKMLLKSASLREDGLLLGLADKDERIVGLALGAALKSCPRSAAQILMKRGDDATLTWELRSRAIRALAASGSVEGMHWIVARTLRRHWFKRTLCLREKSPILLSSISGLATHWSRAPEASTVLELVARSRDAEIRSAGLARGTAA